MTGKTDFLDRATRLPAWRCVKVEYAHGWRHLSPREICLLAELFEDHRSSTVLTGIEALGVTLGVLRKSE